MTALVFFDVDGTLTRSPSGERLFWSWMRKRGELSASSYLLFAAFLVRYGYRYGSHVMQKNKAWLAGMEITHVAALADQFVCEVLMHDLYAPALAALQRHRDNGDEVWLLTGTPAFIGNPLARELGVAGAIASRCAERDGRFAFAPPTSHPYGLVKKHRAADLARSRGVSLRRTWAYGNSLADVDLMRAVGHPVAVLPDRKLRAVVRHTDWPVMDISDATSP